MAKWIDTRPDRPANPYVVMGVQFVDGVADLSRPVSANAAQTFAALGIIPEAAGPAAPEAVEPEAVEPAPAIDEPAPARAAKSKPKS